MGVIDYFIGKEEKPKKTVPAPKAAPKGGSAYQTGRFDVDIANVPSIVGDNTYDKFKATVDAMSSIPNEGTRYIAAFAGLSVGGVTKDQLYSSLQSQISTVKQDRTDFHNQYEQIYHDQVQIKKDELADKSKQLVELSSAIEALNKDISASDKDLKDKEAKFLGESHDKEQKLNVELDKINQYIQ